MMTPDDMKSLMEGFLRASQESTQKMIEAAMKMSADQSQRQQQQFEQCTQQMVAAMQQSKGSSASDGPVLVDAKGVAKPDKLTSDVANDLTKFKTWKLKYTNWICAACSTSQSWSCRGERGFFLSTARRATPRGVVGVRGARSGGRFTKRRA